MTKITRNIRTVTHFDGIIDQADETGLRVDESTSSLTIPEILERMKQDYMIASITKGVAGETFVRTQNAHFILEEVLE